MSEIDTALSSMWQDAENTEKQNHFYNLFLNTTLIVPSVKQSFATQGSETEEITLPMIVPSEGKDYLVLFDSEERLNAWAGEKAPYLSIPGHAVADFSPSNFHWALNPATDHTKEFIPDEIVWLKKVVAAHKAAEGGEARVENACPKPS